MNKIVITVPEEADGTRADKFLAEAIDIVIVVCEQGNELFGFDFFHMFTL